MNIQTLKTHSFLLAQGSLPDGPPALRVDTNEDQVINEKDGFLMTRDPNGEWAPLEDLEALSKALQGKERSSLGIWNDRRAGLLRRKDGEVQTREVEILATRSYEERAAGYNRVFTPRLDPSEAFLATSDGHAPPVLFIPEIATNVRHLGDWRPPNATPWDQKLDIEG